LNSSQFSILISLAAIILAAILLIAARLIRRSTGLPEGKIVFADHGQWGKTEKSLYDSMLGLTGKPDYLVRRNQSVIPVEIKSMWAPRSPYNSHLLQLGAYCLLVEKAFNHRPAYGLLRYRNRTFRIPFTSDLENDVLDVIGEIQSHKELDEVCRSHDQSNRCARCGYRNHCDQRL